jgi:hypothetical protein
MREKQRKREVKESEIHWGREDRRRKWTHTNRQKIWERNREVER